MLPLALGLLLLLIVAMVLALKGARIEVEPATALVYMNMGPGTVGAYKAGTHFLKPGQQKQGVVSLRNEPREAVMISVNTADLIPVEVPCAFREFRVVDTFQAIVAVWTQIKYEDRYENTLTILKIALENAIGSRQFDEIYDPESRHGRKDQLEEIEREINSALDETVEKEWGLRVQVEVGEGIKAPEEAPRARGSREGEFLRAKAEAAGENPNVRVMLIAEALGEALRGLKKGNG